MTTRRATLVVSAASRLGLATVLAVGLGAVACAGGSRPLTQGTIMERTEDVASSDESQARPTTIDFDNEATVHVDVYIVTGQSEWRLGRVVPGARVRLRVPQSAIESTMGIVRLTVIPGFQRSAQAARDPRAVLAIAQPMSELLSQRWIFRPWAMAAMQLQGMMLSRTVTR